MVVVVVVVVVVHDVGCAEGYAALVLVAQAVQVKAVLLWQ